MMFPDHISARYLMLFWKRADLFIINNANLLLTKSMIRPVSDALLEEGRPLYNQQCKFVVDKINDQAKMHGEFYVFQSVEKLVVVTRSRVELFTFTVKEVASNRRRFVHVFSAKHVLEYTFTDG